MLISLPLVPSAVNLQYVPSISQQGNEGYLGAGHSFLITSGQWHICQQGVFPCQKSRMPSIPSISLISALIALLSLQFHLTTFVLSAHRWSAYFALGKTIEKGIASMWVSSGFG
jgi:hypothetical protein